MRISNLIALLTCIALGTTVPALARRLGHMPVYDKSTQMLFYVVPDVHFLELDDLGMRKHYCDILDHVGRQSNWGRVGLLFNFPYTSIVDGSGPKDFKLDPKVLKQYEKATKSAHDLNLPVMVGLNGNIWANSEGAFNAYWKTVEGGKFLSRYIDGKVNAKLVDTGNKLPASLLKKYLAAPAGDSNYLTITQSSQTPLLRSARLKLLNDALQYWLRLSNEYPGTITSFTTDSEVSYFSFRRDAANKTIPIGYEDILVEPFCRQEHITKAQLLKTITNEDSTLTKSWHHYRSQQICAFVRDTVRETCREFPTLPVYTHQLAMGEFQYKKEDQNFDSPFHTAVVRPAIPGFTLYVWSKRDSFLHQFIEHTADSLYHAPWGAVEFNCGKDWKGTHDELKTYTHQILTEMYNHNCRVAVPISWNSSKLDDGIKDSGLDAGIKDFIERGPVSSP